MQYSFMKISKNVRRWQLTALVLTVIGMLAWGVKVSAQGSRNRKPIPKKVNAAAVYVQNCARCHGADGTGTALGKALNVPDLTDPDVKSGMSAARVREVVTNGEDDMPAFKGKLKANEITAVSNYVRGFKRK